MSERVPCVKCAALVEKKEMKPEDQCALTQAQLKEGGIGVFESCKDPICGHKFGGHHADTTVTSSDSLSVGQKRKKTLFETKGQVLSKKAKTNDETTLFVRGFIPKETEPLLGWVDRADDGLRAHLYKRKTAVDVFGVLSRAKAGGWRKKPVIVGPPGTGKTTTVWQWVQNTRQPGETCIYLRMVGPTQNFYAVSDEGVKLLVVDSLVDCGGFGDFVVLDGVRSSTLVSALEDVRRWCHLREFNELNSPVIVCMSLGAPKGKPEDIDQWGGDTFFVLPWSWEEMLEAANDDLFVKEHYDIVRQGNTDLEDLPEGEGKDNEDKRKQLFVDAMFWKRHWAGTSARYMFFLPLSKVKKSLEDGIECVTNYDDLLKGVVGTNAPGAVHRLFFKPPRSAYAEFTSPYVLQRLMRRDKTHAFFNGMEGVARETKNQAFLGWVFEARIGHMIYLKAQSSVDPSVATIDRKVHVQLRAQQGESASSSLTFSVDRMLKFDNDDHTQQILIQEVKQGELTGDVWMIPNKFNQGCFDFVTLRISADAKCQVWAWQATVAGNHSKKLSYLRTFVNAVKDAGMAIENVNLCALLPNNSAARQFKWEDQVVNAGRDENAFLVHVTVGHLVSAAVTQQ